MYLAHLILAILVGLAIWFIALFNRLVRAKNLVRESWSGMDVQLKRRHDLIPNLVETIKGYTQHEQKLFEEIADMRRRSINIESVKEKGEAENALSRTLKTLLAVAEAYPELKANQNFLDLQNDLAEIEDQIQLARRYYNGTVRDYNILVESFPSNLVASLFRFRPMEFFDLDYTTADESELTPGRKPPTIKF